MSSDKNNSKSSKGKRKKSSSESVDSLYMRRQQLLREMQSSGEEKAISIREQLRTLEELANNTPTEDDWGKSSSRRKGSLWMLWLVLGIAVPTVLIGTALLISRVSDRGGDAIYGSDGFDFDTLSVADNEVPEDWFVENSVKSTGTGLEILEELSAENLTQEDLASIVRNEEQIERILARQKSGNWPAFDLREPSSIAWQFSSFEDTAFMCMIGPRADYSTFRAYFVRDGEDLVFDVDATEGWSQVPIVELPAATLEGPSLTRGWVAKEPHFDARSDATKYSWYQILTPDLIDFVWAYTEANGALDELLKTELNYGRVIGDRKREFRAAITLAPAEVEGFQKDEFLLEELVAVDWVLPDE